MDYELKQVQLRRIYLDNENARHDPIDAEPDIVAHLVEAEYVKPLARDIVARGSTSPLERLAVFPHPEIKGSYIAAEGNRRLCALKLLGDPNKAPEGERSFFRQLASKLVSPIDELDVVVFTERKAARQWVSLRHEGPQDGVGTRDWNARQKARFNEEGERKSNPNILAVQALDYALKNGLISRAEHDRISVTTITRFLESPVIRNTLGLISRWDLSINVPEQQFKVGLQRLLKDALAGGKSGVTSRTNKRDRETYAHKLRKEGAAPKDRVRQPLKLDSKTGRSVIISPPKQKRHNRNPDLRPHVIPSDFVVQIKDKVLKRIFDELREIDTHEYSFATAYLFRAFIEQSARVFCRKFGLGYDAELHILIGRVEKKLQAEQALNERELKPLRVMASEREHRLSPETLGEWVHGTTIPTRAELNRRWESLQPCLEAILSRIN